MDTIKRLEDNSAKLMASGKKIRGFLEGLLDSGSFVETDVFTAGKGFLDGAEALGEGVITGYATIDSRPVYLFAQNSEALKGSFSLAQAKKIQKVMDMAIKSGSPFMSIIDSAGARLGEGVGVLEGYAELIRSAAYMKGVVPHVVVVKGAAVGMMATYAALGDFIYYDNKEGYSCLNAPMAVAAAAKKSADNANLFGAKEIKSPNLVSFTFDTASALRSQVAELFEIIADEGVQSDDPNRQYPELNSDKSAKNVFAALCDNGKYIELARGNTDCIITALAKVNGFSVGIIVTNPDESGLICKCGLRKAKLFVEKLQALDLPLITIVNAKGVKSDLISENKGIALNAAKFIEAVAVSDIKKIAVITGDAIGYIYSAFASKGVGFDYSLAFDDACIAPVSAETAVNFLYLDDISNAKDPKAAKQLLYDTYTEREGNPFISAKDGYVDNIIEPATLRPYIASILNMLA